MRERIVAVLAAIESDEGISFQCSQGIASILNQIGYDKGTIIYQIGNEVYSENYIGEKTLLYTVSEDILPNINSGFNNLTFEEKSTEISKQIELFKPLSYDRINKNIDFDLIKYKTILSLHNPMGRYGYGMCWAASAATVINYRKLLTITPFEICNHLNIGYNSGGTIYNEQAALLYYNVSYNIIKSIESNSNTAVFSGDNGKFFFFGK